MGGKEFDRAKFWEIRSASLRSHPQDYNRIIGGQMQELYIIVLLMRSHEYRLPGHIVHILIAFVSVCI